MKEKLVFFDLDGTLTLQSTWLSLNLRLGITSEEDNALFERYVKDDIAYNDWMKELVRIHQSRGSITKKELIDFIDTIELRSDAASSVMTVKKMGYHSVLLSGSVDLIVEAIAKKLHFDAWRSCSSLVFDDMDVLINIVSNGDEALRKETLAREYAKENNFTFKNAFCVGDGGNDIELFKEMKGILLGDNKKLEPLAWKKVSSLSEIGALL